MINFTYYTPTRIVFGKGAENNVGALIKEQGCKKVLVHYGSESAKRSGLLDRVFASLDDAGIDYVSLGGVGVRRQDVTIVLLTVTVHY